MPYCSNIYSCLPLLILDFFCNFKDRFPGDRENHYITFTLLTAVMVCVCIGVCTLEDMFNQTTERVYVCLK